MCNITQDSETTTAHKVLQGAAQDFFLLARGGRRIDERLEEVVRHEEHAAVPVDSQA